MKKLILVVTLVIVSFAFLNADVYIKTKTHTDAFEMMGQKQPAKDQVSEQWLGDNKFAQIAEGQTMVLDLSKNVIYVIYHGSKSYVEAKLPLDMSKLLPEQMAGMMEMMKMTVAVKPTGESKKVGDWNCKGYDINMTMGGGMMSMNMKSWVTTDVPFDWKAFSDKMFPHVMKLSGSMGLDENALKEFKKVQGFQVAVEMTMNMMGQEVKATSQVVEISKKAAPAGTYSVPAGYTKQDKLTIQRGM
ncbi:MAG: DUF4412 domain-containing protein [Candidatus Aminicenantes bacterium]|nr:DUF4412 domain-containing protein [Candidatus Aminicenantes bacterium]NIM79571.1 DUF4412 domain-containing protein [Candidatus Aminicenantes bacterium]NIN18877.1 DUF4412 domain-containing protein [Candidatus Aminicenantes bacterium]NIN42790.1 DUF4412 domain-containing protein [Candidatus Aminicenantes bacterium]NIN85517.1 DUF4412 domain-containing protein [Candidatus Aminicenantes bacterium]